MRRLKILLVGVLFFVPVIALAGIDADDLPETTTWYFHADFGEMRASPSGNSLYKWLDAEIFEEIREESGVDLASEADHVTAYSAQDSGVVLVLDGQISQGTRDKVLAIASGSERFDTLKSRGKTYYYVVGDDEPESEKIEIDGIDKELFFSFDVKNKLIATSKKEQMELLLANKGRIPGEKSHDGSFFILTAESSLIQAGMKPDDFSDEDGGFESNVLRHTKQLALMIANVAGKIAIEARLVATEPEMAQSLAGIIRGLIALQAFSDDLDPDLSALLNGTRVDVEDNLLKISLAVSADVISAALDDA